MAAFERPAIRDGAPDYTAAAMARKHEELATYRARLAAIDPNDWPISGQVDHHLVRAEMNGLDFNIRVLRPWARDPAFYASVWTAQSDTPATRADPSRPGRAMDVLFPTVRRGRGQAGR